MSAKQQMYGLFDSLFRQVDHAKYRSFLEILKKIVQNILANPNEDKFRAIKKTNATLQQRLFISPLVGQILTLAGFAEDDQLFLFASDSLDSLHTVDALIGGFEVQLDAEANNQHVDPEEARRRQEAIDRELGQKQAELQRIQS